MQALTFFFAFVAVLALIGAAAWLVRRFANNRMGANTNRGRMPRLAVIDATAVDGRRRLVLVRRDNIEHLIMIGGPSDIVVEPNIIRATPLVAITPHTEVDPTGLLRRIEQAARQGYAIVQNQTVIGDISVAAAITDHDGKPVGAINISVPATRWSVERAEEQLLPHVLLAATSISHAKGG